MSDRKSDILSYLVKFYKDIYAHKDLIKINFKYPVNEIESTCKEIQELFENDNIIKSNTEQTISDEIQTLKTPDDIKEFLLKYRFNGSLSKDDLLNKFNRNDFNYLYKIIYLSPLKSNIRKEDALNAIERYFYGISRAVSMKP
jgi:hypothetical protein